MGRISDCLDCGFKLVQCGGCGLQRRDTWRVCGLHFFLGLPKFSLCSIEASVTALGSEVHLKHDAGSRSNLPRRLRKGFPGDDWGEFWPLVAVGTSICWSAVSTNCREVRARAH